MLRSCLHFGILVCFLTGCQQKPDSRSETAPATAAERPTDHVDDVRADVGAPDSITLGDAKGPATGHLQSDQSRSDTNAEIEAEASLEQVSEIRLARNRFRELDKRVVLLEVTVFDENLGSPFEDAIGRLYDLRNEVALSLAQAETAPPAELERRQERLVDAIDELDRRVKLMVQAIEGADGNPDDDLADRIWL